MRRRRLRYLWLRYWMTVDFLHQWGERAWPPQIRFVWTWYGRQFDQMLREGIAEGAIDGRRYPPEFS